MENIWKRFSLRNNQKEKQKPKYGNAGTVEKNKNETKYFWWKNVDFFFIQKQIYNIDSIYRRKKMMCVLLTDCESIIINLFLQFYKIIKKKQIQIRIIKLATASKLVNSTAPLVPVIYVGEILKKN